MNPWILAIRPRTLPAAIGPLLVGNVLASTLPQFSLSIAFIATLCAVLLQIAVNLANDYFDFKNGIDTDARLGPVRVTQSGLLSPNSVRNAMILVLCAAIILGFILINHGGWIITILAVLSVLGALGYSGGPYPLASHGLGELAAFVFFGLIAVVGSFYLQAGFTNINAWLLGAAIGFLNAAIMLVNNTRDIETDRHAKKFTLAVSMGEARAKKLYQILIFLPFAIIFIGYVMGILTGLQTILTLPTFLIARHLSQAFTEKTGQALNPLLGRTAQLTLVFSLVFSLGTLFS